MANKTVFLIANGQCDLSQEQLAEIHSSNYLIAIDGGIKHCIALSCKPQIFVGDLDSASEDHLKMFPGIIEHRFPKEKDETDLELALKIALQFNPDKMRVFAALGNRIDHQLQNIQLLSRYPGILVLESSTEKLLALPKEIILSVFPGQLLSLFPLNGSVHGITTKGLRWELQDSTLDKHFASISNICLGNEVVIRIGQGDLICILLQGSV